MDPRFTHIRHWVFDLDQTLYPPETPLFPQIETRMAAYITRHLGLAPAEAAELRSRYWRDHGATLAGLMHHHGIDAADFLRDVHEIDLGALSPAPELAGAIAALPGQKIVMTNGGRFHAGRVLDALGLTSVFDGVYSVEDSGFRPKPEPTAYDMIFAAAGVNPSQAAMFEDDPRNLVVPAARGVATILVGDGLAEGVTAQTNVAMLAAFLRGLI